MREGGVVLADALKGVAVDAVVGGFGGGLCVECGLAAVTLCRRPPGRQQGVAFGPQLPLPAANVLPVQRKGFSIRKIFAWYSPT